MPSDLRGLAWKDAVPAGLPGRAAWGPMGAAPAPGLGSGPEAAGPALGVHPFCKGPDRAANSIARLYSRASFRIMPVSVAAQSSLPEAASVTRFATAR